MIGTQSPVIVFELDSSKGKVTALAFNLDRSIMFAFQMNRAIIPLNMHSTATVEFSKYVSISGDTEPVVQAMLIKENTAVCRSSDNVVFLLNLKDGFTSSLCESATTYLP